MRLVLCLGDDSELAYISLDGLKFWARKNLDRVLHQLKCRISSRFLWIDAICIDQTNESE
jgi:hypothetical protein